MLDLMLRELDIMRVNSSAGGLTRFGRVKTCEGGLIEVTGLPVAIGTLCRIAGHEGSAMSAEVVGFRGGNSLMMLLGDAVMLQPGAMVTADPLPGMVAVGEPYLGRAVDGSGQPIDGQPPPAARSYSPLGGRRGSALDRASIAEPFDCGVRAINALATMGIGQRLGIVAGSGVGKSVLLDMIARHAATDIVIVALIGERAREVSDFVARHMRGEAAARTVMVAVPADHAPNLRLRGAEMVTGEARAKSARLVETTMLSPGVRLAVIEFRGREILVGSTRHGLTRLAEADVPRAECQLHDDAQPDGAQPNGAQPAHLWSS